MADVKFDNEVVHQGNSDAARINIVVATRKRKDEFKSMPLFKTVVSRMRFGNDVTIERSIAFCNTDGLGTVYNSAIRTFGDCDIYVFVHDDIWINDVMFVDKLMSASKNYDVIGCCGGKAWGMPSDTSNPIIWTYAANDAGMSGFMVHASDSEIVHAEKSSKYDGKALFATNYGVAPSAVLTLDGSFICFTRNAVSKGLRFDENFKFHFYDMDVSFEAYVRKLKVGTSAILLTHESLGTSAAQSSYMDAQRMFLKKWFSVDAKPSVDTQ